MKTKFILVVGLITSAYGYGQTYSEPSSAGNGGTNSVHIGEFSGANVNNAGYDNVFVGYESGLNNETGGNNVFLGVSAGSNNISGINNLFSGYGAGSANTAGSDNTYLGTACGLNANGSYNSFVGRLSGQSCTSSNNSFIGAYSGRNATGGFNVCIGQEAGQGSLSTSVHLGEKNVLIGYRAGRDETGSNKLYISNSATLDPLIYGDFSSRLLEFNGTVGIGNNFGTFPTLTFANASNYRLLVRGGILAYEVRIRLESSWADYVFSKDYNLLSLQDTEKFIAENGHLPNMPSAAEVKEQGLEMGNIIKLQQEKIEELTLHAIAQEKRIEALEKQLQLILNKQ